MFLLCVVVDRNEMKCYKYELKEEEFSLSVGESPAEGFWVDTIDDPDP